MSAESDKNKGFIQSVKTSDDRIVMYRPDAVVAMITATDGLETEVFLANGPSFFIKGRAGMLRQKLNEFYEKNG